MNTDHQNQPGDRPDAAGTDRAWESAMSRDFDARVRGLTEAPLSLDEVKGKAVKIRRNRRIAAAGGAIAVAAAVTPIALVAAGNGEPDSSPPPATQNVEDPETGTGEPAYVVGGVWHQADGDEVTLPETPHPYSSVALWDDRLVATRWDGEVFSIADVFDAEGDVIDSFPVAGDVVADDTHQTIAWVAPDGSVMTEGVGGKRSIGELDMSAPGETIAWSAAAVVGGPDCSADECRVFVNSALAEESVAFSSLEPGEAARLAGALEVNDAHADGDLTVITKRNDDASICSGRYLTEPQEIQYQTCRYAAEEFSPDGRYIAALSSYQSGLGAPSLYILDAETGRLTDQYGVEGGHVGTWAWAPDGRLLFDTYDGAGWHLWAMEPGTGGEIEDLVGQTPGEDVDSPFLLIQH